MRNLVCVLIVLVLVGLAVVGYYREWYSFGKTSDSETGKTGIQLNIDQNKIHSDYDKAKKQVSPSKGSEDGK